MLKKIKNKFFFVLAIDALFFSLISLFLFFAKTKIKTYLEVIQGFGPALTNIAQQDAATDALITQINSVVNHTFLYVFVLIPLIFFLAYLIFQSVSWFFTMHAFQSEKLHIKKYVSFLWKFSLISFIPFASLFGLIYLHLTEGFSASLLTFSFVLLLFLFYLMNLLYVACIDLRWRKIGIFFKSIPAFLFFILLVIFSILFFGVLTLVVYGFWKVFPFLLINLLLIVFLRFSFVRALEKKA